MGVVLSRILLAAGAASLTVSIVFAVNVGQSYQRAAVKDDFTGFSLGMHFLLYGLVPLTLSLFVAACLLNPPAWLLRRLGVNESPPKPSRTALRTVMVPCCLVGAVAILLGVAYFVGGNLVAAARHYDYAYRGLAVIFLQNLVLSSPLLMLSALLAWTGRALKSRARHLESHRAGRHDGKG